MIIESFILFLCWTTSCVHSEVKKSASHSSNAINGGVREFKELIRRGHAFIDKTLFVKDILEHPSTSSLIICPGKWGKTINLDTLKTFLEIEVDQNGNVLSKELSTNYKLFRNAELVLDNGQVKKLTPPLLIAEHKALLNQHLGKYPVISVDFNDTAGENYAAVENHLKSAISRAYQQHKYIVKAFQKSNATEEQKKQLVTFQKYLTPTGLSRNDLIESIEFLSKVLHEYFGKTVYVLLENYDIPLHSVLHFKKFPNNDIEQLLVLIEELMGISFTFNDHIEHAIIIGTFRLNQPGYQPRWSQYSYYSYAESPDPMIQHFGFRHTDVEKLFQQHNLTALLPKVKDWYNGYKMSVHSDDRYYHPDSILSFLHYKRTGFPLTPSINLDFLVKLLVHSASLRAEVLKLINRNPIVVDEVWLEFKEETLLLIKDLIHEEDVNKMNPKIIYQRDGITDFSTDVNGVLNAFLLSVGILSPDQHSAAGSNIIAQLTNNENAKVLTEKVVSAFLKKYNIERKQLRAAATHLRKFIIDQNTTSSDAENSLKTLYEHLPAFDILVNSIGLNNQLFGNEDPVYTTLNYVLLEIQHSSNFTMEVALRNRKFPDVVVHGEKLFHATAIQITFNQNTSALALREAQFQEKEFIDVKNIVTTKYIGINVQPNKSVQISGVYNDTLPWPIP